MNKRLRCTAFFILCMMAAAQIPLIAEEKKEEVEMRVVIAKRAGRTKSMSYLCFPLISDER